MTLKNEVTSLIFIFIANDITCPESVDSSIHKKWKRLKSTTPIEVLLRLTSSTKRPLDTSVESDASPQENNTSIGFATKTEERGMGS